MIMKKSVINNNDIARDSKRSALIVSFYVLVLISGVIISVIWYKFSFIFLIIKKIL